MRSANSQESCPIKILILSNAPWNLSGYGTQALLLGRKLREHGHEVAFTAFHGLQGPAQGYDGFPVFGGSGEDPFSRDVLPVHYRIFGADLLITLMDMWVLEPALLKGMNVAYWMPVDCEPLGARDKLVLAQNAGRPVALSRFGHRVLSEAGYEAAYVPHSLDLDTWSPLENRDAAREFLGLAGKFVVGINAANQDPMRKGLYEQLRAFKMFSARHEDALLLLHTRANTQNGVHLEAMLNHLGLKDQINLVDQPSLAAGLVSEADMVSWHGVLDVLSNCSWGEGFGLATLQAQACGTPVVVTDWSASAELCGAGWRVGGQETWNNGHDSDWLTPSIAGIAEAYERAYEQARDPGMRDAARLFALGYDADLVYAKHWAPVLAELDPARAAGRPRRVFSTSMLRDELDMLEMRLSEAGDLVDCHVVAESKVTHRGVPKPLHYLDNADRFEAHHDRIAHVVADLPDAQDPWVREHVQRDSMWAVIDRLAGPDDVVLICDVDEIPSRSLLERARAGLLPEVCSVQMRTTLFAVDWEVPQDLVPATCVAATARYIRGQGGSLAAVRDKRETYPVVKDGGWHFSWLGGEAGQLEKLEQATCHTEVLGTPEGDLIASGERYRTGAHAEGHLPVAGVDVDESWPAFIRDGNAPAEWFRPRD